jgi:hypothetical protein
VIATILNAMQTLEGHPALKGLLHEVPA